MKLFDVPGDLVRRAAQHIESIRGTRLGYGTDRAALGERVCPMYRPDLDGIAYWEFVAVGTGRPRRVLSTAGFEEAARGVKELGQEAVDLSLRGEARGFLILSAGPHDSPLVHWSLERSPISVQLQLEAERKGASLARIYKVDALCYVGEDESGRHVAQVGQLPGLIAGLPEDLDKFEGAISSVVVRPKGDHPNDQDAESIEHVEERSGYDERPDYKLYLDGGWQQLKKEYAHSLGPFLEQLRNRAAHAWEVEELVKKFGEGIIVGERHRVALLGRDASIRLTGEAAEAVRATVLGGRRSKDPERPPAVELGADGNPFGREASFELQIRYADGREEELRFFIVERGTPSGRRTRLEED